MILPGETEAGTAGTQPCRRDIPVGLIETMNGGVRARSCAAQPPSDRKTPCLENPRRRAEYSLTENVASPFQAEPRHTHRCRVSIGRNIQGNVALYRAFRFPRRGVRREEL